MKRYAGLALLPPLIAAAWFSIYLARADAAFRRATPESVAQAVALAPSNADYLLLRAMQVEYDGADPTPLLERAAELDPMNATPLIRLGLAAEIRGDFASAEKNLLEAARVNRQFEPRWTLANFYFRRGNMDGFWRWIRTALDVSYGDRREVFDLCWNASSDANAILQAIPDRREVLSAYLRYLTATHHEAAIPPVALKVAALHESEDQPAILASIDALIAAHDGAGAQAIWRALGYTDNAVVFRGNFDSSDIGGGFDWKFIQAPGVTHIGPERRQGGHRILLDGSEPESTGLLAQWLVLTPNARYQLRWQSQTHGLASPTGIEWRIGDQRAPVAARDGGGEFDFTAPADLIPLTLNYSRPSGETRADGSLELWGVAIRPINSR